MIDKYVNEYIDYLQDDKNLSLNTIMSYNRDLKIFFDFLSKAGIKSPEDVNKTQINNYIVEMIKLKKSNATLLRYIATIKSYYSYLIDVKVCTENPAINLKTPKVEKKAPGTIGETDMLKIINIPDSNTIKGKRDKAILATLYYSGVRVSELISLNTGHYDRISGIITIGGKSIREVKISDFCADCLNDYLNKGRHLIIFDKTEEALFLNMKGSRMTRQGLWKIIKYYCKDLETDCEITPHTFRHSIAANLLLKGEDINTIKEMLGHADIYSTKVYRK